MQRRADSRVSDSAAKPTALSVGLLPAGALMAMHLFMAVVDTGAFTWAAVEGSSRNLHFGGIMDYLTICSLLLQAVFMWFSVVVDVHVRRDVLDAAHYMTSTGWQSDIDTYFTERVVTRKTAKLIRHRDRYFTLAFVTGNAVGLGFWIMLYPHASYPNMWQNTRFYQTILEHGFTWLAIWVETLLVRHRYRNWCPEFSIVMAYGIGYLAWNFLCFDENGVWVYPSIQANKTTRAAAILYAGLACVFAGLYWIGRGICHCWWASRLRSAERKSTSLLSGVRPGRSSSVEVGIW